ncbi:hypothetical protein F4801DRAFT_574788 [Xylaria longipes]|nr:hypothetical protein F4801DRAFT_574788 [Xylaria longipes]
MSSSRNTMKWDAKVHEDILVAINEHAKLAREDWDYVIQALHGMVEPVSSVSPLNMFNLQKLQA